ncbi:hypothetical protein GWK47_018881 [Chionoecetes opilio]|uniref:HAT C-terminal dimerisation domain-containing protein n=1 Tax=Chionoecetes opilio TaxID=41210 RepID=A0A8J5CJ79_CHIOP|nr:hypothetical protein GWK47_018881 [Chionoecetes opilio]
MVQHWGAHQEGGGHLGQEQGGRGEAWAIPQHAQGEVDLAVHKYNTALPSSAAVERMFSTAGDVLRPKRASMTSDRFEKLVFTKGNMQLLDAVLRRERREGECDSERETDVE